MTEKSIRLHSPAMQRVKQILEALLLVAAIVLVCLIIVIVQEMRPKVANVLDGAAGATKQSTETLKTLDSAMTAETEKLKEATKQAGKTEYAIRGAVDSFRRMTDRTDKRLNDEILPDFSAALRSTDSLARDASRGLDNTVRGLEPTLTNLAAASRNAAANLSDPAIPNSLKHVDEATASLADSAKHFDGISANAETASELALNRFRQALKPASLAKTIFMRLLGLAGPAAQVATAVK